MPRERRLRSAPRDTAGRTAEFAVRTSGLTKRFGRVTAVDGVDLAVPAGSVYGFLGPNGSGKTTTIRMLLGLVAPSAGTFLLLDEDGPRPLERTGALIEGPAFHPYLSARANLARLDAADRTADPSSAHRRIGAALDRVGLTAAAGKRYRVYSLGMRQRLGIAAALLRPRALLVLDEPTNGLDPQGTREIRTLIGELADDGVTIMLSSHLLGEVRQVCTDVGVMSAGRLVWQGPLADLAARRAPRLRVRTDRPEHAARILAAEGLTDVEVGDDDALGTIPASAGSDNAADEDARVESVVSSLVRAGVGVRGVSVERAELEDLYVDLTGEGFDVSG